MSDDQKRTGAGTDPEERAFTGGADMPPEQPDQPAEQNQELLRDGSEGERPPTDGGDDGHGDYTGLPGYGG